VVRREFVMVVDNQLNDFGSECLNGIVGFFGGEALVCSLIRQVVTVRFFDVRGTVNDGWSEVFVGPDDKEIEGFP
jgi:hypothetical protein